MLVITNDARFCLPVGAGVSDASNHTRSFSVCEQSRSIQMRRPGKATREEGMKLSSISSRRLPRIERKLILGLEPLEDRVVLSNYWVSPTGSDSNPGSQGAPWQTLQHAADSVVAGDTVDVLAGTYDGFVLGWDFPQSGTASAPITFNASPGVVIDGPNPDTPDGINLEGASYIIIQGFTINNPAGLITRAGIRSVGNTNVIIRNNSVDGAGRWGIFTGFSENVDIEDNSTSNSKREHGIYVSNSADNPIIRHNRVWGNHQCGIQLNADVSQGGDGIISNALISDNVIYDNGSGGGSGINCDGVQDSRIENNLLYNNHASGIALYMIDAAAGSSGNTVVNNTVVMASDARWALLIGNASTGNQVDNNILYTNRSTRGSINISTDSLPDFRSDHNIGVDRFTTDDGDSILALTEWQKSTGQDKNSIISVPSSLFADAPGNDYHLSPTSPAIDAGMAQGAPGVDLDGNPRPRGKGYDIGAYEFQPASIAEASVAWGSGGTTSLLAAPDGLRLLPAGRKTDLPWLGINRFQITLNGPATLTPGDVKVTGIAVASYGPVKISGSGSTYTITLARPIMKADRVTIEIAGANIEGYTRRLDVLPGDVNDDGIVNRQDLILTRTAILGIGAGPTMFGDINGDGRIDIRDYLAVRKRFATKLPS
jgi:parallel beta-helix repeat protein